MKSLGEYIKSNKSIQDVCLFENRITDIGLEILLPYFDGNKTFMRLFLHGNMLSKDKSIPLLLKIIEISCIEKLLPFEMTTPENKIFLAPLADNVLKNGNSNLSLVYQHADADDLVKICASIEKYGIDNLKHIELNSFLGNDLKSKEASILFDTLKKYNSTISSLNLMMNQLDDNCMKSLGEFIKDNEHLELLALYENPITDNGVKILAEYLCGNATLKELSLGKSETITDESALYFIEMAQTTAISSIHIQATSLSEIKMQDINEAFKTPVEQRRIPVKSNTKSAAKTLTST